MEQGFQSVMRYIPMRIRATFEQVIKTERPLVQEIRLRVNRPVSIRIFGCERILVSNILPNRQEMDEVFQSICRYSVHSFAKELVNGFITLPGGHRVGLCGTAINKGDTLETIKNISSLNFRIASERPGCSSPLHTAVKTPVSILLAGPPSSGKTTVLRDLCRHIAEHYTVSIVDERGEIAAVWQGVPGRSTGFMSDILDGYSKPDGIAIALRTMAPTYIAVDEIGSQDDCCALQGAINSGVKLIATAHAGSIEELFLRPALASLFELDMFDYVALLGVGSQVGQVIDLKATSAYTVAQEQNRQTPLEPHFIRPASAKII